MSRQTNTGSINFLGYSGYGYLITSTTTYMDCVRVYYTIGFHNNSQFYKGGAYVTGVLGATGGVSKSGSFSTASWVSAGNHTIFEGSILYDRGTADLTKNLTAKVTFSGSTGSTTQSITIPALQSWAVTYNAGTGAPDSGTKYYNIDYTVSSTAPTRSGYTFTGWNTTADGTGTAYAPGATYSANNVLALYAQWARKTYAITLDANGGSFSGGGKTTALTKTGGTDLVLSTSPTMTNYNLLGWSTSSSATTATYTTVYNVDAPATLYAVWQLAYIRPQITNLTAARVDSTGALDDDGTYARVQFNWSAGSNGTATLKPSSIAIAYKKSTDSTYTTGYSTAPATTSGTINKCLGVFSADYKYDIKITIVDATATTDKATYLSATSFTLDVTADGTGMAIGKAAQKPNLLEIELPVQINSGLTIGSKTLLDLIHPVGSLYISANSTDPATLFGGTWTRIKDKFILAAGDTYSAGATGGEATHTLTTEEMPEHNHTSVKGYSSSYVPDYYGGSSAAYGACSGSSADGSNALSSSFMGGGQAHNNMPPYLVAYVWQRTA